MSDIQQQSAAINWTAPEFEYRPKTSAWYWGSMIVAALILGLTIWQKNFLFGVFVIMAEILIIAWGARTPRMVSFALDERGLTIDGKKFYAWSDIKGYAPGPEAHAEEEWAEFTLQLIKKLHPIIYIYLPAADRDRIEQALALHTPKIDIEMTLLDTLEKFVGF